MIPCLALKKKCKAFIENECKVEEPERKIEGKKTMARQLNFRLSPR